LGLEAEADLEEEGSWGAGGDVSRGLAGWRRVGVPVGFEDELLGRVSRVEEIEDLET